MLIFSATFAQVTPSRLGENGFEKQLCSLDCFHPGEKVVSPKRGYGRPSKKVLGASVFSRVFSSRRWGILAQGESIFA